MKEYRNRFLLFIMITSLFLGNCTDEDWNNHYKSVEVSNIISSLRSKGYGEFASAMEKIDVGNAFSSGMDITVFALSDQEFQASAGNLQGEDLKFFVLNHLLAGKLRSVDFTDSIYHTIGGGILYIRMDHDSIYNYYKQPVKVILKDVEISGGMLFEISKAITLYPNLYQYLSSNYPFFYGIYRSFFIPDTVRYPLVLGFSSEGLKIDSVYKYNNIFTLSHTVNNLTFVVSKSDYITGAYDNLVSKYLPYFAGNESVIRNDIKYNTALKHFAFKTNLNQKKDSLIIDNYNGAKVRIPVSKIRDQITLDNGNKLLLVDTLLYTYPLRRTKYTYLATALNSPRYSGDFNTVSGGVVTWNSVPKAGDYVECTIPADSIYTKPYDMFLQFSPKSSYARVKVYFDGDSLKRVDLSTSSGATQIIAGSVYQLNLALNRNVKQYSAHTIRFEIVAPKGSSTEVMKIVDFVLKLKD